MGSRRMQRSTQAGALIAAGWLVLAGCTEGNTTTNNSAVSPPASQASDVIALPPPTTRGGMALSQALAERRSVRTYADRAISLTQLGQLLWAAQGVSHPRGLRTAPSAGALYPLELYLIARRVDGLPAAIYHYRSAEHDLRRVVDGDQTKALTRVARAQSAIESAAVNIAIVGVLARTAQRYGERAPRYLHLEAGHVAQNLHLQATALGLASLPIGAFEDHGVAKLLHTKEQVLYLIAIGRPKSG